MRKTQKKFGFAFGDLIEVSRFKKIRIGSNILREAESWGNDFKNKEPSFSISSWRLAVVYVGMAIFMLVLFARVFELQIIKGHEFLNKAEGNRIQLIINHAPRGVILDRYGVVLAQNIPSSKLIFDPLVIADKAYLATKLTEILGIEKQQLEKKLNEASDTPITLVENLPIEKISVIEAESQNLLGIRLEIRPIRYYPFKETTAHILGYTLEADEDDLEKKIAVPYSLGDQVGKAGVELSKESILRGVNGYSLVSISANGEQTGEIYDSNTVEGRAVTLSIDAQFQKFVYNLVKNETRRAGASRGSAVVLNSKTGEVLSLVSIPSFDNNLFAKGIDSTEYLHLLSNVDKPLLNRAIGSSYPPGSTFKLISSAAGLETGVITPSSKIEDTGFIKLGNQIFRNWLWIESKRTEGSINVVRALARSTDTFFFRLGQLMGEEQLQKHAKIFGLGSLTGIELQAEVSGLVPTQEWKIKTKGEPWYPGETLNLSIGQGDLLTTPLQISVVSAVFANGGKLLRPTILKVDKPEITKENFLKQETIDTVKKGMYANTTGDGGVAWLFGDTKYKSGGKTGTSESGQEAPHAWYTAYAPHPEAEIVVTVMIEHAGHGSEVSAPMVKKIFDWWFKNRN